MTVYDTGLREQSTIYVKDIGKTPCYPYLPALLSLSLSLTANPPNIGPQIAWRTVFILEYLGPILIHPILYFLLPGTYGASKIQTITFALVMFHFLKREFETFYIHRFSTATMPLRNLFNNSTHYWILGGVNLAYWNYRPNSPAALPSNPYITYPAIALFIVGEAGNLYTHVVLRNLRSSGGTERGIPKGWGFGLVTCPNYMFEAVAWLGVALLTWSWSSVLFLAVALLPMGSWAKKKEARYRKEFGNRYRRKRFVMLPGIW